MILKEKAFEWHKIKKVASRNKIGTKVTKKKKKLRKTKIATTRFLNQENERSESDQRKKKIQPSVKKLT